MLDTLLPGIEASGFDAFYKEFTRSGHLKLKLGFKAALFAATWIAPLLVMRLPPLSLSGARTRRRALEKVFSSRSYLLRQTSLGLKLVLSLCYGADPEVRRALGVWQPGDLLVERLR